MKNKGILAIATVIGVLAIAVFLLWQNRNSVQQEQDKALSKDGTTVATDYSLLEKDRLYTEEEGKYANLNDTGKQLLRALFYGTECENNPHRIYCFEEDYTLKDISLVSLKDKIALFRIPNGKGGSYYLIYDVLEGKQIGENRSYFGTSIKNDQFVIYVKNNYTAEYPSELYGQELLYYKPGMRSFNGIEKSSLPSSESYWYYGGMGSQISETTFKDNILNIAIFEKQEGVVGATTSKKIREVTFDLTDL